MKSKFKKATTSSYGLDKKDSIHGSEHLFCWHTSLPGFVYICYTAYWNTNQGAKRKPLKMGSKVFTFKNCLSVD